MTASHRPSFATLALHAGAEFAPATDAQAAAEHMHAIRVDGGEPAAALAALAKYGGVQTRAASPTVAALEERIAALEDGVAATAASSGRAALLLVFHMLMKPGEEIIAARAPCGGAIGRLATAFHDFGWGMKWAAADDLSRFAAAIGPQTKAIFIESMPDAGGALADIEAIAAIAKTLGVPLIVDNTRATPYLIRPLAHGAYIVTHSGAGMLGGQSHAQGGFVIDGGGYDWLRDARYPMLSKPRPDYGGMIFAETFGNFGFAAGARALGLRDLGGALSPLDAYMILTGVETLALRMQRHCDNAAAVAAHLVRHPAVRWLTYPGLPSDRSHALAQKYCPNGAGPALSLGLAGGHAAAAELVSRLRLFSPLAEFGDSRSRAAHSAATDPQFGDAARASPQNGEVVGLSIGIEDVKDIIADLDQALAG